MSPTILRVRRGKGALLDDYYFQFEPKKYTISLFHVWSLRYQLLVHKDVFSCDDCANLWWKSDASRAFIAGGFAWTGFDYKGQYHVEKIQNYLPLLFFFLGEKTNK